MEKKSIVVFAELLGAIRATRFMPDHQDYEKILKKFLKTLSKKELINLAIEAEEAGLIDFDKAFKSDDLESEDGELIN
jgi:hypothetical protein